MPLSAHWYSFGISRANHRARNHLKREGLLDVFDRGSKKGRPTRFPQNYLLYSHIRTRRPNVVLEFGSGWSTITIAYALKRNHDEDKDQKRSPRVYVMEANEAWLANTIGNVPVDLHQYCEFIHATPRACRCASELAIKYDRLPNISPELILLDGPSPSDVVGEVDGLGFMMDRDQRRSPIVSDVLLYESTIIKSATIMVESRLNNTLFLMRHLKRPHVCTFLPASKHFVFEINPDGADFAYANLKKLDGMLRAQSERRSRFRQASPFALMP